MTAIFKFFKTRLEYNSQTSEYVKCWEDLRFPATGISLGGFASPPDVQTDTGLLIFAPGSIETVGVLAQLPHSWVEGSAVRPHVHWAKTSDAAGDVVWSLRWKQIKFDTVATAWSSIATATDANDPGSTQKQVISSFGDVDMTGYTISSLLLFQLGRLATDSGDDYAADAVLYEFDLHYQVDSTGSEEEYTK